MKSIIDELYHGDLSTSLLFHWTNEYKHDVTAYTKAADRFRKTLNRRRLKTFNALEDQVLDLSCHETQEYFHMGFCIGALFLLKVMQFKERLG